MPNEGHSEPNHSRIKPQTLIILLKSLQDLLYEFETTVCPHRKELISVVLTIAGAYCRELERAKDDEFLACVDYYRHLLSVEADAAWWSQALREIYSSPDHTIQAMLALLESAEQFVRQTVNAEMKPALLADI